MNVCINMVKTSKDQDLVARTVSNVMQYDCNIVGAPGNAAV